MSVINWSLAKHWQNWLIILFMLIIAATGGHLLLSYFGVEPKTSDNS